MSGRTSTFRGLSKTLKGTHTQPYRCLRCNHIFQSQIDRTTYAPSISRWRTFSTTPPTLKKSGKVNRAQAKTDSPPGATGHVEPTAVDDAFDFSGLQAKIMKATEFLAHQLSQLRAGGRFNPETLESLKVELKAAKEGEKGSTQKLKDLAQVVAKGRNVNIICHEAEQVKAINSAILASTLNLTPHGPSPEAPTTLHIQIPPPTGESRKAALESASKSAEEALGRIREARGAHQKKLRAMQVAKKVRPDDLQKASMQMESVVKSGNEEIKKILENSKKVLEN